MVVLNNTMISEVTKDFFELHYLFVDLRDCLSNYLRPSQYGLPVKHFQDLQQLTTSVTKQWMVHGPVFFVAYGYLLLEAFLDPKKS